MSSKLFEFLEDNGVSSMARLAVLIGVLVTSYGTIYAIYDDEYNHAFNFASLLVGLGGVNYGVNRVTSTIQNNKRRRGTSNVDDV